MPGLTKHQAEGNVRGVLVERNAEQTISLGGYRITVRANRPLPWELAAGQQLLDPPPEAQGKPASPFSPQPPDTRPRGSVIAAAPDEFLFVGSGMDVRFVPESTGPTCVGYVSVS